MKKKSVEYRPDLTAMHVNHGESEEEEEVPINSVAECVWRVRLLLDYQKEVSVYYFTEMLVALIIMIKFYV